MRVHDILDSKGRTVVTIDSGATVDAVVRELSARKIGFLIVTDQNGSIVGVLSERDVVQRCLAQHRSSSATTAAEIMTHRSQLVTANEEDEVGAIMSMMTQRKVRHLPVFKGENVTGLISIGDVIKFILEEKNEEIRALTDYVSR